MDFLLLEASKYLKRERSPVTPRPGTSGLRPPDLESTLLLSYTLCELPKVISEI